MKEYAMPKATFYTHVAQPAAFACRLIARAIRDGGQILVWSDSAAAMQQLDIDLWQQIPESFIPHEVWLPTDPMPSETPVLLAFGNSLPNIFARLHGFEPVCRFLEPSPGHSKSYP